jgi:multiple sugar transport system substrate-binding protein
VPAVVYKKGGGGSIIGEQEPQVEKVLFEPTQLYTIKKLQNTFVSVVAEDVVLTDEDGMARIYGLPLSLDTLQLFYNRELLDKAGIAEPPKTWNEFVDGVKKLRQIDGTTGEIKQAAAGLGRADNVDRAADILMLLMKQNGAILKSEEGDPRFDLMPPQLSRTMPPGPEGLAFYTDFSNPSKSDVYTWNKNMPTSLDMFSRGNLAYFFGYSYHIGELLARAPKLNYAIASVPQLNEEPINMANYWVEAVSKKSKNIDAAWDFLYFATQEKNVSEYLKTSLRPTALRSLVKKQLEDEEQEQIAPFVSGVLTAIDWYNGSDYKAAERSILSMIRRVNEQDVERGANVYLSVVRDAVHQVRSTR